MLDALEAATSAGGWSGGWESGRSGGRSGGLLGGGFLGGSGGFLRCWLDRAGGSTGLTHRAVCGNRASAELALHRCLVHTYLVCSFFGELALGSSYAPG